MLFISNVFCDEKQDVSTIFNPHIFNNNLYAQNELITNKTNKTQLAIKDTVSISPILKRPNSCFSLSLDTIILPGINIGYGWMIYDSTYTSEEFVTIHANTLGKITAIGIYLQKTKFKNTERVGWFGFWKLGIDYGYIGDLTLGPGDASSSDGFKPSICPNISLGMGYSFKIGNNSYFRITGDIGIKLLIGNLTFSYVF
jgi:hypothetical protein